MVAIEDIDVGNSWRPLNHAMVDALAAKIEKNGQKTPIELVKQKKGKPYRMVAGRHRLAAIKKNGDTEIRADIFEPEKEHASLYIELAELDENLDRYELNHLDRAVFIGRREEIYLTLHPETARGAAGANARHGHANETLSFAEETAELIGLGVRAVQRSTRIYKGLEPEIRARISGTALANKEGELYKLTRYSEDQQAKIVDACLREDNPAPSVSAAAQELDGRSVPEASAEEKELASLQSKFADASKGNREAFLTWLQTLGIIDAFDREQLA